MCKKLAEIYLDPDGAERQVFDLHDSGWCGSLMWNPRGPLREPVKD
jgi:hypothetical protein